VDINLKGYSNTKSINSQKGFLMLIKSTLFPLCLAISLTGCFPQSSRSGSSFDQVQQRMAEIRASNPNIFKQPQAAVIVPTIDKADIVTDEVLASNKEIIYNAGSPAEFSQTKQNIIIDGKPFVDPEGEILTIGSSNLTGEFTYLIAGQNAKESILKYNRANSGKESLTVAVIRNNYGTLKVFTINGKSYSGTQVTPISSGLLISRDSTIFQYSLDSELKTFNTIDGFHIAKFQNGDVANTGYILLEKNEAEKGSTDSIFSSIKGLGSTLGLTESYEYLLANIATNKVIPLNLQTGDKNVSVLSGCKKGNNYINKCENMSMVESLYDTNGQPNYDHYYWSVNWLNTNSGPIALYKESSKVKAVDLKNSQEFILFSRMLGVNYFKASQDSMGKIKVKAKLGFSSETI
jgi:hypothetical protein